MSSLNTYGFISLGLVAGLAACDAQHQFREGPVDFDSPGAKTVRQRACAQDWTNSARKGAGAETHNASLVWSVSPYQLLIPSTGTGFTKLNVDAPHYDWLVYLPADYRVEALDGPALEYSGPVEECPDQNLVEYGAHHTGLNSWMLRIDGERLSRARFYAGLAATDHSDPEDAGHAGHDLDGDGH